MNYQLAFWIVSSISGGLAVAQIFRFLPSKSEKAIERILYLEKSQNDLRRIATALEFFADQFPAQDNRGPYFERLLITFQEWVSIKR